MKTFKDKPPELEKGDAGEALKPIEWKINLTVGTAIRVKDVDERFNLFEAEHPVEDKPLREVLDSDFALFWELLWVLLEPQAEKLGIDAVEFGERMANDCIVSAQMQFFRNGRIFSRACRRRR